MVELVCGVHHVSSGGGQGKFQSGEASAWASPRESNGGEARSWGCFIRELEVSQGDEASDGASPPKLQEGEVHNGTSPWELQVSGLTLRTPTSM